MTEREIIDQLERWSKEGAKCRDEGGFCPYPGNSLAHYMHTCGWLKRDLQLGLCLSNEAYRKRQIACGNVTEAHL